MEPPQDPIHHERLLAGHVDDGLTIKEDKKIAKLSAELSNLEDEPGQNRNKTKVLPTGEINIAMFEDTGPPKPAGRPGKNLDVCLTNHRLPGQSKLVREERQFFRTFFKTLTTARKRKLKKASKKKKLKTSHSSKQQELQHHHKSQKLPVTRHVIHREDTVFPCNHFNPVRTKGLMRQDENQLSSKRVHQLNVPSSPALPTSTPIERASSATVVSSPNPRSTPTGNQGAASDVSGPPVDPSFDPTSLNNNTHIWNWRTRTYEPVMPEGNQIRYEYMPTYADYLDFKLPNFESLIKL